MGEPTATSRTEEWAGAPRVSLVPLYTNEYETNFRARRQVDRATPPWFRRYRRPRRSLQPATRVLLVVPRQPGRPGGRSRCARVQVARRQRSRGVLADDRVVRPTQRWRRA